MEESWRKLANRTFLELTPVSAILIDFVGGMKEGTATTGDDDLRNLAVGRLFLDNFEHIKSHWIMVSQAVTQISLHFGVNDIEGTVVREKIYHAVGAHTPQGMTLAELLTLIRGAGKQPAERDSFYRVLRDFADDDLVEPVDGPSLLATV